MITISAARTATMAISRKWWAIARRRSVIILSVLRQECRRSGNSAPARLGDFHLDRASCCAPQRHCRSRAFRIACRQHLVEVHHEGGSEQRRGQADDRNRKEGGDEQASQEHLAGVLAPERP